MDPSSALVSSVIASPAGIHDTVADLRAIIARTDEQLASLRRRKIYDWRRIAFLTERRERCVREVEQIERGA